MDQLISSYTFRLLSNAEFPYNMDIEFVIRDILIKKFNVAGDVINANAEFKKDLGLDSLDVMDLVIELEVVSDPEAENIFLFSDAVACVQRIINK
ncbi:phosphopantetheine-binding protein [Dyadobacter sp. CY107]|uniref:phosphopantetheine-binding protein n=1 Tax=Dyadobacter fanqingshengii TaxID=2906443 RepID=UPI001F44FBC8|nr:phosphopantetheine-binding protein [Dyadobacter fanqingshengii]MCF2502039.1 phosphopantetheine-binding protein [Dyadobacter fanqingshengii]